jgi:hypothetical protein
MPRIFALCLALTTALAQDAAPHSNQTQKTPPENTIRVSVNLVQVDAVVTDSKGKQVTDLKAEDFEILQDGKPQIITGLSYITTSITTSPVSVPSGPSSLAAQGGTLNICHRRSLKVRLSPDTRRISSTSSPLVPHSLCH